MVTTSQHDLWRKTDTIKYYNLSPYITVTHGKRDEYFKTTDFSEHVEDWQDFKPASDRRFFFSCFLPRPPNTGFVTGKRHSCSVKRACSLCPSLRGNRSGSTNPVLVGIMFSSYVVLIDEFIRLVYLLIYWSLWFFSWFITLLCIMAYVRYLCNYSIAF